MGKWQIPQTVRNAVANIWAHHNAEVMKLQRLTMAKDLDLNESHVNDFPPSRQSTNIQTGNALGTAVTAASILGAVGVGAAGIQMLSPKVQVSPPAIQSSTDRDVTTDPVRAQVELFYNDPEKGLVPISGAISPEGAELTAKP